LGLLACILLKSLASRALARRNQARRMPLVPGLSQGARVAMSILLTLGAYAAASRAPVSAMLGLVIAVLLSLDRAFAFAAAERLQWVTAPPDARVRRRSWWRDHFGTAAWLDATTCAGSATLIGALSVIAFMWLRTPALGTGLGLLCALGIPHWHTATRRHLPWDGLRAVETLEAWQRRHGDALRLAHAQPEPARLCTDEAGRPRDARVPLKLEHAANGMLNATLSIVTDATTLRRDVALLVEARPDSAADRCLLELPRSARRTTESCAIHIVPSACLAEALRCLTSPAPDAATTPERAAA
jgi:hypothetical protein